MFGILGTKDMFTMMKSSGKTTGWEKSEGQNNEQNQVGRRGERSGQGDSYGGRVGSHNAATDKSTKKAAAVRNKKQVLDSMDQEAVNCGVLGCEEDAEGCVAQGWVEVWDQCFRRSMWSERPSMRWMVALIQKLWDVAWDLWEGRNGIRNMERRLLGVNVKIGDITDEKFSRPPFNIG